MYIVPRTEKSLLRGRCSNERPKKVGVHYKLDEGGGIKSKGPSGPVAKIFFYLRLPFYYIPFFC